MDTKDSDRELLKWAAKAAGYEVVSDALASSYGGGKPTLYLLHNGPSWNPLTDDGDALRLAVKLAAKISHTTDSVLVSIDGIVRSVRSYYGDPYAATRRAIVRAAAEIGRNMP